MSAKTAPSTAISQSRGGGAVLAVITCCCAFTGGASAPRPAKFVPVASTAKYGAATLEMSAHAHTTATVTLVVGPAALFAPRLRLAGQFAG
ncbi:hypothetical protein [Devosia sp.]|uniref:hypothetical protein n=1 Tax=Devosia sp. TaxID=1871048 RepID=UPI002733A0E5|nr:hypothetical protein [Devosia sp.]MDP2781273.1 hypothetical protein [Devosia sp.]